MLLLLNNNMVSTCQVPRCTKMDHFCPWYVLLRWNFLASASIGDFLTVFCFCRVGGAVGENNLKFFIQFTGYTAPWLLKTSKTHFETHLDLLLHHPIITHLFNTTKRVTKVFLTMRNLLPLVLPLQVPSPTHFEVPPPAQPQSPSRTHSQNRPSTQTQTGKVACFLAKITCPTNTL
jgi:hypothetical protein